MEMKITIEAKDLRRALDFVRLATGTKASLPILGYVRIDGATIYATNLYEWITVKTAATVLEPGAVCLPIRALRDATKGAKGAIVIDGTGCVGSAKLPALPADYYPAFPAPNGIVATPDAEALARALGLVSHAQNGDTTSWRGAVLLDGTCAVASDGHRLARAECPGLPHVLIPATGAAILAKMLHKARGPVGVSTHAGTVFFMLDGTTLAVKVHDDAFPPYQRVIPKLGIPWSCDRNALIAALKAVIPFVYTSKQGGLGLARFTFTRENVTIFAENLDKGTATQVIPIDYAGADMVLGLNPGYLLAALNEIVLSRVVVSMEGDLDPIRIDAPGFTYVQMPGRV